MTPDRDPRVDPMPGDVVEHRPGWFRLVSCRGLAGSVLFSTKCGKQWLGRIYRESLAEWQAATKDATVIRRAEEERHA